VDCFDKKGTRLYAGNAKNCLQELTARFGTDIVFQIARLFPVIYQNARTLGAKGVETLKDRLKLSKCSIIKDKLPI